MNIHHRFIPHPKTHEKSPFLHWHALLIYILLFILLQVGFDLVSIIKPGILGINSQISVEKIIEYTNLEREKLGLAPLKQNQNLNKAAEAKAANMFEENYWAHFAPSGKDPWNFILRTGYKFSFAGENLARNFYNSEDVVKAWINSASHRENIINKNYQEIGVAVVDGILQGQKTTLVVQMFGKPYEPLAQVPQINLGGKKVVVEEKEVISEKPILVASSQAPVRRALLDPFWLSRTFGTILIFGISFLLVVDFIVLKKRGIYRLSGSHFLHVCFLAIVGAAIVTVGIGSIL